MDAVTKAVALLAAVLVMFSAITLYAKKPFATDGLRLYGVPERWWPALATLKAAGAVGLAVGLAVPAVGVAAAAGLGLYFLGAVVTILRARIYGHLPYPLVYMAPAVAAGVLLTSA